MSKSSPKRVEKNVGKRRNCLFKAISPFPHNVFRLLWILTWYIMHHRDALSPLAPDSSFSNSVFKRVVDLLETHENKGLLGKGLHDSAGWETKWLLWIAGVIETDIHFTKTGTALGATDIRLPKPRIILGETDMFLEVSTGHEIDMRHTQIAVSPSQ